MGYGYEPADTQRDSPHQLRKGDRDHTRYVHDRYLMDRKPGCLECTAGGRRRPRDHVVQALRKPMTQQCTGAARAAQRGYSLVELSVAMVIALFLLGGLLSVLQG